MESHLSIHPGEMKSSQFSRDKPGYVVVSINLIPYQLGTNRSIFGGLLINQCATAVSSCVIGKVTTWECIACTLQLFVIYSVGITNPENRD